MLRSYTRLRSRSTLRKSSGTPKWKKHENKTASEIGARLRPASGAIAGLKGDAVTREYMLEMKETSKQSYPLKLKTLRKMSEEARKSLRVPVMVLLFSDNASRGREDAGWVVMPYTHFLEIRKCH